jgi:hypothetical protein
MYNFVVVVNCGFLLGKNNKEWRKLHGILLYTDDRFLQWIRHVCDLRVVNQEIYAKACRRKLLEGRHLKTA